MFTEARSVLKQRRPTCLYRRRGSRLQLLIRHRRLSGEFERIVGGSSAAMAEWAATVAGTPGDLVVVHWALDGGETIEAMPEAATDHAAWCDSFWRSGLVASRPSDVASRLGLKAHELPVAPDRPVGRRSFAGEPKSRPRGVAGLLRKAFRLAARWRDPGLVELICTLSQADWTRPEIGAARRMLADLVGILEWRGHRAVGMARTLVQDRRNRQRPAPVALPEAIVADRAEPAPVYVAR